MITLVVDVIVPFITISILNAILIRAINHRNKDLEEFNEGSNSKHSSNSGMFDVIVSPVQFDKTTRSCPLNSGKNFLNTFVGSGWGERGLGVIGVWQVGDGGLLGV